MNQATHQLRLPRVLHENATELYIAPKVRMMQKILIISYQTMKKSILKSTYAYTIRGYTRNKIIGLFMERRSLLFIFCYAMQTLAQRRSSSLKKLIPTNKLGIKQFSDFSSG